jgi:hypothetical protein
MAVTTKVTSGAGLRRCQIYLLDTDGYPSDDESGISGYDGEEMSGIASFEYTTPDGQVIVHVGKDRVLAQDQLPSNAGATYRATSVKQDLNLDAMLTDTLVQELGEAQMGGLATSKQGAEPDVAVLFYRQALDTAVGASNLRRWQLDMFPVGRLVPKGGPAGQGAGETQSYQGTPGIATKSVWGTAFTEIANGFTDGQILRIHSEHPFRIERFTCPAGSLTYTLQNTPISVAKTYATLEGVAETIASVSVQNKTATITSSPSASDVLVIGYETTDAL